MTPDEIEAQVQQLAMNLASLTQTVALLKQQVDQMQCGGGGQGYYRDRDEDDRGPGWRR